MSALLDSAAALTALLDREREAGADEAGTFLPPKLAALSALEALDVTDPNEAERDALGTLAMAASGNAAALEVRRDAARALVRDLGERLVAVDADGIYTRAELIGAASVGSEAP